MDKILEVLRVEVLRGVRDKMTRVRIRNARDLAELKKACEELGLARKYHSAVKRYV